MSNETKAQLKYYLDHGSSPTEIARILHISRQSVYNYKKKHPVDKNLIDRALQKVYAILNIK